jgi:hypothetical protein
MRILSIHSYLGLAFLCLLSACGGLKTYHVVLSPAQTAQDCKSNSGISGDWWCKGVKKTFGEACDTAESGVIGSGKLLNLKGKPPVVGFFHRYDSGTDPAPCWEYVNAVSRAYVSFQPTVINKIEKVVVAKLTWDPLKHGGSNQPPYCFKKLYEATGPWEAGNTPGNLITDELDQPQVAKSIFVTEVVQKWAKAGWNKFGFFFTATNESMSNKNNKGCETTLNSLQLEVTYLGPPPPPWP